jgi:hypothetical protein
VVIVRVGCRACGLFVEEGWGEGELPGVEKREEDTGEEEGERAAIPLAIR